jgi:uncharacterized Zn finger protein (UPF0148 family)
MADEKDRLGNKLRDVEAAREDQWARQRDAELLEKMSKRITKTACPQCKELLVEKKQGGILILACPSGHGAWLDEKALKGVLKGAK